MSFIKAVVKSAIRTPIHFASGVVIGSHITPRLYAATIDAAPADAGVIEKGARAAAFLVMNTAVILTSTYLTIKVVDAIVGD